MSRTAGISDSMLSKPAIDTAASTGDLQRVIGIAEVLQLKGYYKTNPQLCKYACHTARFLLVLRYGTPRQPKLAASLRANTPIRIGRYV